jgi:hypothetical protein
LHYDLPSLKRLLRALRRLRLFESTRHFFGAPDLIAAWYFPPAKNGSDSRLSRGSVCSNIGLEFERASEKFWHDRGVERKLATYAASLAVHALVTVQVLCSLLQ